MPATASNLVTPVLLLAMPQVLDPFFHKSVVLLIHHEEEGSVGFIVNRPTGIKVSEILNGMEVGWQGREDAVAYFGGPVQPQLGSVLFESQGRRAPEPGEDEPFPSEAATEVVSGVSLTQHVGDLSRLAEKPPERFRLFLGYAGWGSGQLLEEILRNDWLTAPVRSDLIFGAEPEQVWTAALHSVGVDPAALPSWTAGSGSRLTPRPRGSRAQPRGRAQPAGAGAPPRSAGRLRSAHHRSAGGLVVAGDRILLISTQNGRRWQLPKGHIEDGETAEEAAIREIREETGVTGRVVARLQSVEYWYVEKGPLRVHKEVDYFLLDYVSGDAAAFDHHEVSGAEWFSWEEGVKRLSFENERRVAREAQLVASTAASEIPQPGAPSGAQR
jgi:putative transcriptional regulator